MKKICDTTWRAMALKRVVLQPLRASVGWEYPIFNIAEPKNSAENGALQTAHCKQLTLP